MFGLPGPFGPVPLGWVQGGPGDAPDSSAPMPVFREVEVFPNSGWEFAPWVTDSADEDAFVRRSRGICEAYSQALPRLGLPGKASLLRLFCEASLLRPDATRPRPTLDAPVSDAVHVDPVFIESFQHGNVWVAVGFANLPLAQQQTWALRVIHQAVVDLAHIRGWDVTRLDAARRHVETHQMRFQWEGPWKSSPDRRHQARCVVSINDDGMGRARLEVANRSGAIVADCTGKAASSDGVELMRLCKTVRWHGPDLATVDAVMDPYGTRQGYIEVRLDRPTDRPAKLQVARQCCCP